MPFSLGHALATDLYQLTMAAGYFHSHKSHHEATCELFVRRLPKHRRYLVALGIEEVIEHLLTLRFKAEDLDYLRSVPSLSGVMTDAFSSYLEQLRFSGDVWAIAEGTVMFENEPFLCVRAPIIEAQLVETMALSIVNHATTIGSKAARVVLAAQGRKVVEFGTRRTHGDAAVDAAKWAYLAGFSATSNVLAGQRFGLPITGTAAHMWIMSHRNEAEAFRAYAEVFPESAVLLVDTYDTLQGSRLAARLLQEKLLGVRIDSGDLLATSRAVREILDQEGAPQAKIVVSGDLNEHSISALLAAGAPIDTFGVGTEVVCSVDAPALGGVYKLVELDDGQGRRKTAKFSPGKETFAGKHQVLRVFDERGKIAKDVLASDDEAPATLGGGQRAEALLSCAVESGARTRAAASYEQIRARVKDSLATLPAELLSLEPRAADTPSLVRPSAALVLLSDAVRKQLEQQQLEQQQPEQDEET